MQRDPRVVQQLGLTLCIPPQEQHRDPPLASTPTNEPTTERSVGRPGYRLPVHGAHMRMTDLIFPHGSGAAAGAVAALLTHRCGADARTASSLARVELRGNPASDNDGAFSRAGFFIHSAVHAARPGIRD